MMRISRNRHKQDDDQIAVTEMTRGEILLHVRVNDQPCVPDLRRSTWLIAWSTFW